MFSQGPRRCLFVLGLVLGISHPSFANPVDSDAQQSTREDEFAITTSYVWDVNFDVPQPNLALIALNEAQNRCSSSGSGLANLVRGGSRSRPTMNGNVVTYTGVYRCIQPVSDFE